MPISGIDLSTFDNTVRPQDDLYQHVNGAWLKATEIPDDRPLEGTFTALRLGNSEAMQSTFPIFFVFLFFSSMAMPRDLIEQDWFRFVATINPLSYLVEGIRSLYVVGFDWEALGLAFGLGGRETAGQIVASWYRAGEAAAPRLGEAAESAQRKAQSAAEEVRAEQTLLSRVTLAAVVPLIVLALLLLYVLVSSAAEVRRQEVALAKLRAPGSGALGLVLLVAQMIPGIVMAIGFYAAFAGPPLTLYGTAALMILAFTARFLPIAYANGAAGMQMVHPEMEEAVRILGGGRLTAIRHVNRY